ncbi:hypothetical protein [Pseudoalteromonas rubra]|uniref:hypothetical protein n=1 Tax=Pseudoalteromonas rubra TaxID=43658 RepID=UPI000F7B6FAD|nr:hypothetical protein [Pseudoalteromonas rubra]
MKLNLSDQEKNDVHANLKMELIYICIPFFLLITVKAYQGQPWEILTSPEWALASCIIFGQITSKVTKGAIASKGDIRKEGLGLYVAKRVAFIIMSLTVYFFMIMNPTKVLGSVQIALFIFAIRMHFSDGFTAASLEKQHCKK